MTSVVNLGVEMTIQIQVRFYRDRNPELQRRAVERTEDGFTSFRAVNLNPLAIVRPRNDTGSADTVVAVGELFKVVRL